MSRAFHIECVICNLAHVRESAVAAGLDHYFLSEVDHLIATAEANREYDNVKENTNEH